MAAEYTVSTGHDFQTHTARYRVIERLGRGGNSDVYLCQAIAGPHKGLLLAAKLMTRIDREDRARRFQSELDFLQSVSHPGVMRVFDHGTQPFGPTGARVEVPFYIAEYLPKTLREVMRGGILIVEKMAVALQLVSTLAFLAASDPQIVHRDIKPENIFIRGRTPVIGDFGLLKALGAEGVTTAFEMGDLSSGIRFPRLYPTPDLIAYAKDDSATPGPKSDVFQLGIVLTELFCDEFPIKQRTNPLDPIIVSELPSVGGGQGLAIRTVVARMLELDPNRRPDAEAVADAFNGIFSEVLADARKLEGKAFW
jgi:serine/threonine protein kinase